MQLSKEEYTKKKKKKKNLQWFFGLNLQIPSLVIPNSYHIFIAEQLRNFQSEPHDH